MIAKISTGRGARGVLGYVLGNKKERGLEQEEERERGQERTPERAAKLPAEPARECDAGAGYRNGSEGSDHNRKREHGRGRGRDVEDASAYRDGSERGSSAAT